MGSFDPSDTLRAVLVDPDGVPYDIIGLQFMGSFNPSDTARICLVDPDGNPYKAGGGGGGGVTAVTASPPVASSGGATPNISIANAAADGATKGAAAFTAADFNASSGVVSLDYANGQKASGSQPGFLSSADWTTFNNKLGTIYPTLPGLRLTLTTGVPVTTSNVTGAGTLFWTPYLNGAVGYWTGSAWATEIIAEQSLVLTITSGKNYDVFYLHGTGLVLSSAWTDDTTRADALGTQDGVTVLASDHTKLWIGTIRASGSNTTEDSLTKRLVWNAYNRVSRELFVADTTTSWSYGSSTWRAANNNTANAVQVVSGSTASYLRLKGSSQVSITNVLGAIGIGEDRTNGNDANYATYGYGADPANDNEPMNHSALEKATLLGFHTYTAVEAVLFGTAIFVGNITVGSSSSHPTALLGSIEG